MALEDGNYINQLDEASPDGLDPKSQGDDHLRLIKKVLKRTFSKITGPVNVTHVQLNSIALPGVLPVRGMIMLWRGSSDDCPGGWAICDGSQGTPDLRDRFIRGAGRASSVLARGGTSSHSHGLTINTTVQNHTLTVAQIPPHDHLMSFNNVTPGKIDTFNWENEPTRSRDYGSSDTYYSTRTSSVGSGAPHTHGARSSGSASNSSHIPPFVALFYIMKL